MTVIDPEAAWAAFAARDRRADARFVIGVTTTGIYCRASCPARRPARAHVAFFAGGEDARTAGFRPCLRCRPDEAARDGVAITEGAALIAATIEAGERAPGLAELAAAVGYAPDHFARLFRRATGVTPAAYARALRAARAGEALTGEESVTDAVYAAGYGAPSRFYAEAAPRLGMTPGAWRRGGAGETIRWTIVATSLGSLLVASTARGLCRVAFDEDGAALARRFPAATLCAGDAALDTIAARVAALVEAPGRDAERAIPDLPLDLRGTAFQARVWAALRAIPTGESVSYAQLAAAAGTPAASRAAGSACGANPLAVVVPCHRVRRGDGGDGGYAWGVARKRALLARERGE